MKGTAFPTRIELWCELLAAIVAQPWSANRGSDASVLVGRNGFNGRTSLGVI
jgi:hypothetical protein